MMSQRGFILFFFLIMIFAGFVRFYRLGQIPAGTYWDETAMLMDARSLIDTGRDVHGNHWLQAIYPSYGDYKLPVYLWLVTLSVSVFGPTALAVRMPSALAGMLTVLIVGLIAGEVLKLKKSDVSTNEKRIVQLLGMFVSAVSFWSIHFSRLGFEAHLGQLWLGFSFYLILIARRRASNLILAGLFGALGLFTYFSTRFVWPVVLVAGVRLIVSKQSLKQGKMTIFTLFSLLIFGAGLLVMRSSPLYPASQQFRLSAPSVLDQSQAVNQANLYRNLSSSSIIDRIFFHRYTISLKQLLQNYSENLSLDFLFLSGDPNLRHGTGIVGLFPLAFLPLLFIGLISLVFTPQYKFGLVLVIWWLAALLPASVALEVPHALRSLNALIPLSLIITYGLFQLIMLKYRFKRIVLTVLILTWLFQFIQFWNFTTHVYPQVSATAWQAGFSELAEVINTRRNQFDHVFVELVDQRYFLWVLANSQLSLAELPLNSSVNNYHFSQIGNVYFNTFSVVPTEYQNTVNLFVIDGSSLSEFRSTLGDSIEKVEMIEDGVGNVQFVLITQSNAKD